MTQRAHLPTLRKAALVAAGIATLLAACVPPGARTEQEPAAGLEVSFAPESAAPTEAPSAPEGSGSGSPGPTASVTDSGGPPSSGGTPTTGGGDDTQPTATDEATDSSGGDATENPPVSPAPPARPADATITDPSGDVEPGRLAMDPPDHADLVGATLARPSPDTFTLRIDLLGGAPDQSRDERHTMNVASFYDVDGDGSIDFEIWANLSSTGWGTSQFDNDEPSSRYGADDDIEVAVEDGQLVLTFPPGAVGGADRFRWALAAEWGTYEDLQLGTTSFDEAPDDHRPARFPG